MTKVKSGLVGDAWVDIAIDSAVFRAAVDLEKVGDEREVIHYGKDAIAFEDRKVVVAPIQGYVSAEDGAVLVDGWFGDANGAVLDVDPVLFGIAYEWRFLFDELHYATVVGVEFGQETLSSGFVGSRRWMLVGEVGLVEELDIGVG